MDKRCAQLIRSDASQIAPTVPAVKLFNLYTQKDNPDLQTHKLRWQPRGSLFLCLRPADWTPLAGKGRSGALTKCIPEETAGER